MYTLVKPFIPYLVALLAVLGSLFLIYKYGQHTIQVEWDKERAIAEAVTEVNEKIVIQEVIRYVDRVKEIKVKGDTIVQQVPVYVNAKADAACVVPNGVIRVLNNSAQSSLPGDPQRTDEDPSGVKISTVTTSVADNYITCNVIRENLISLQNILRTVQ